MKKLLSLLAISFLACIGFIPPAAANVNLDCAGQDQWRTIPPATNTPSGPDFGITGVHPGDIPGTAWDDDVAVAIRGMNNEVRITEIETHLYYYDWVENWYSLGGATYKYPKIHIYGGTLRVMVVGTDGNTYQRTWNGSGWNAWAAHSVGQNAYNNASGTSFVYLNYIPPGDHIVLSLYLGVPIYYCVDY